jgi:hypothetical protein
MEIVPSNALDPGSSVFIETGDFSNGSWFRTWLSLLRETLAVLPDGPKPNLSPDTTLHKFLLFEQYARLDAPLRLWAFQVCGACGSDEQPHGVEGVDPCA